MENQEWKTNLEFDDVVPEDGGEWTMVCEEHMKAFPENRLDESVQEHALCGVKGCEEEAEAYLTLKKATRIS